MPNARPIPKRALPILDNTTAILRTALAGLCMTWGTYLLFRLTGAHLGDGVSVASGAYWSDVSLVLLDVVDLLAASAYLVAAALTLLAHRRAALVYTLALTADLGVWIYISAADANYELSALMHTSWINWLINVALLSALVGIVFCGRWSGGAEHGAAGDGI